MVLVIIILCFKAAVITKIIYLFDVVLIKEDNPTYHELMCIIFSIGSLGAGLKDVPL